MRHRGTHLVLHQVTCCNVVLSNPVT
jgi:hypothetical protein